MQAVSIPPTHSVGDDQRGHPHEALGQGRLAVRGVVASNDAHVRH